jgi:tetratricopeptide (TPR) repeat protein
MRILFSVVLFLPLLFPLQGQSSEDIRESFNEGEFFFVRGEYEEAAYYFRKVLESDSGNSHYNFKLGECYLNIRKSLKKYSCKESIQP